MPQPVAVNDLVEMAALLQLHKGRPWSASMRKACVSFFSALGSGGHCGASDSPSLQAEQDNAPGREYSLLLGCSPHIGEPGVHGLCIALAPKGSRQGLGMVTGAGGFPRGHVSITQTVPGLNGESLG